MIKKYIIHITGFILLAFGIATMVEVNFGLAPVDALNMHITEIVNVSYISLGVVSFIISLFLALFSYFVTKNKDFYLSLLIAIILGFSIDAFRILYSVINWDLENMLFVRIILLILGLFISSFGVILTTLDNLPPSPFDRLMVILNQKFGSIFRAKLFVEVVFLTLAIIAGLFIDSDKRQLSIFSFVYVAITPVIIALLKKLIKGGNNDKSIN